MILLLPGLVLPISLNRRILASFCDKLWSRTSANLDVRQ